MNVEIVLALSYVAAQEFSQSKGLYSDVPRERKSTSIQFSLYKVTDPTPSQLVADMDDNLFAQTSPFTKLITPTTSDWLIDDDA